ncbi:CHRD domain-containing protein [Nitrosomonas sp.]|uniref:CHRD domain-containing protein n=1 Tax=Nitrosomonas sp. TaxID=42353 RepID=UPI0025D740CE|nr:CHRD domain-containing protein [Nitrosomonas sp.]
MNFNKLLFGIFIFIGGTLPAAADMAKYAAPLLGSSEVPANASPATGSVLVTIDFDLVTMRVEANFNDLLGITTAAHIHCCIDPGSNVGVATELPSFTGFPLGVTSGSYDHTFDMSLASSYNPAFITNHGGTISSAFNDLVAGLDAGRAYLNIHTNLFPGGEIRGLLSPVPEPESYALLLTGLGFLTIFARRAKREIVRV